MKRIFIPLLILTLFSISHISCEKKNPDIEAGGSEGEGNGTGTDPDISDDEWLLMDSTYYYTSLFSLWNTSWSIPKKESDIRAFTKNYNNAENVLSALMKMTPKIGPEDKDGNKTPVDRYSFIDRAGQVGEEIGQGINRDIGLSLKPLLMDNNTKEVGIFIQLVQKNSPSATAGLKRGFRVLSVDGQTLNLKANNSGQIEGNIDVANKLFSGDVSKITIKDYTTEAQPTKEYAINATAQYKSDPILLNKIIPNINGKKVGYIAYNSFVSVLSNTNTPNTYHNALTTLFSEFEGAGIQELIVDLRYNGGGATNAAELLTNLIVPAGNNGQTMYEYEVNSILQEAGWNDGDDPTAPFGPVKINKTNSLNLNRVYFLVTTSSASASELVINNLKPYMDVQIISTTEQGTYGKPVGFFGYPVVDGMADLYITSFGMVNKKGEGKYYTGLSGTKKDAIDYIDTQLGDEKNENMLFSALEHIRTSNYPSSQNQQARTRRSQTGSPLEQSAKIDVEINKNVQGLYKLGNKPLPYLPIQ